MGFSDGWNVESFFLIEKKMYFVSKVVVTYLWEKIDLGIEKKNTTAIHSNSERSEQFLEFFKLFSGGVLDLIH